MTPNRFHFKRNNLQSNVRKPFDTREIKRDFNYFYLSTTFFKKFFFGQSPNGLEKLPGDVRKSTKIGRPWTKVPMTSPVQIISRFSTKPRPGSDRPAEKQKKTEKTSTR